MTATMERTSAWSVRRMRAAMLETLPSLPGALCRVHENPDLWHPHRPNASQEIAAVTVCMRCPEIQNCLGFAVRAHPLSGIWGGTTEAQRTTMLDAIATRWSATL